MYVEPDGSYTEDTNTAEGDDSGATFSNIRMDFGLSLAHFLKSS